MIIAIDGPAAAGKGTLARRLAEHLGYAHLDSGALYRAVALSLLKKGGSVDLDEAAKTAATLDLGLLDDDELRSDAVAELASRVAADPQVRESLLDLQRNFAHSPPRGANGAVIDGRDIGTVVCPDADIKIFVVADVGERARRRLAELVGRGIQTDYDAVLADLRVRDERDRARQVSPLEPASDAHLLDTTNLDIEAAFQRALSIVGTYKEARQG